MNLLVITGDKKFGPGHPRFELQKSAVEHLEVVYWGRGSIIPKIPKGHFDVITAQDPFFRGHLAMHMSQLKRCRLNIQVHTDLDAQPWLKRVFAWIQLRHADSVRVVSEKLKAQVLRMAPKAKVTVLPIYIDTEPFKEIVPTPHSQKTVLWIGRFEEEKDPHLAISIISKIPGAKLIMLGNGSLEWSLRQAAKSLPVEFLGWDDPVKYLPIADVVLSTSKHESYGASIIESLAAGVPVVAPDVGIAQEAGAIVVAREKLAEAVVGVLQNGQRGELKLPMLTQNEWVAQWKETL